MGARRRVVRGTVAWAVITGLIVSLFAATAIGANSYYRTGTLVPADVYNSVQRADWYATAIHNQSTTNMHGRVWAYNVVTNTYVMQKEFMTFAPTQVYGDSYARQSSVRNFCTKINGGTQAGGCYATY